MIYLRNILNILFFVILLFSELLINTIFVFEYILFLPFYIGLFYVSTRRFSNFYISIFLVAGIYYDTLFSSNILGFTSAKFLITCVILNFLTNNQSKNTFQDLAAFVAGVFLYSFTYSFDFLQPQFLYLLLISSLVNYFLFRILNITIEKNVLKQKI